MTDWSLITDMVKLIISQLDHSITLILVTSCLSLAELAGCGPFALQSLKPVMPALLESVLTSAAVDVREVSLATIMDTDTTWTVGPEPEGLVWQKGEKVEKM